MNFLACEGDWSVGESGIPACTGTLVVLTEQEMQSLYGAALDWDQVAELRGEVIVLFAVVFGFLALKKALK